MAKRGNEEEEAILGEIKALKQKLADVRKKKKKKTKVVEHALLPMSIDELCSGYRTGFYAKDAIGNHIDKHWGTDAMTFRGKSFFSHCQDLIEETDAEDCMCHGFLLLDTTTLCFYNDETEADRIALMEKKPHAILIFCK